MRLNSKSWASLISYGEVVGFALAWVVGIVVTLKESPPQSTSAGMEKLTSVSDLRPFDSRDALGELK